MRLFFIDPNTSDRFTVRSNTPMALSMIYALAHGIEMVRVGRVMYWIHIVKNMARFKLRKGRDVNPSEDPPGAAKDLIQPIIDEIEKAEKRAQNPESN